MAVNFPDNPSNGQTVTFGSTTYTYNSTKGIWSSSGTSASVDNYLEVSNSTVFVTKADAVASNNAIKVLIDDRLQVANLQPQLDRYLQVANSTGFASSTDLNAYLQVANSTGFASSTDLNAYLQVANANFVTQSTLDSYLQVANSTGFASTSSLSAYLQVANATTLTSFDVITTAPSGNGSLIYTSANGSFTFTPANATQGGGAGASVTVSDSAPSSPSAGDLWFDSEDLILYVYYADGSSNQWVKSSPSGVPSPVALSATAPSSPNEGDLWFDTSVLKIYIYYNDGNSSQWVEINSLAGNEDTGDAVNVNWVERTSNTTITAGEKYILDTSSALTITLPASASIGDQIRIIDGTGNAATNNITIGRNGHKIQGSAADMVIDVDRAALGLVYYNATHGWVLIER